MLRFVAVPPGLLKSLKIRALYSLLIFSCFPSYSTSFLSLSFFLFFLHLSLSFFRAIFLSIICLFACLTFAGLADSMTVLTNLKTTSLLVSQHSTVTVNIYEDVIRDNNFYYIVKKNLTFDEGFKRKSRRIVFTL
jgi:hypothetical protein